MHEYLIQGADLDGEFGIPKLSPIQITPTAAVDFVLSKSPKLRDHRNTTVNFYIDDKSFLQVWNHPEQYIDHLKCFQAVCAPDFSIAVGSQGMPMALNIYNKYRNHALAYYWSTQGIRIIPSVNIINPKYAPWIYDGIPHRSTVSCCTNGRVKSKAARLEFCEDFKCMCEAIEPTRVIIVGIVPDELQSEIPVIQLNSRSQNMKVELSRKDKAYQSMKTELSSSATQKGDLTPPWEQSAKIQRNEERSRHLHKLSECSGFEINP